MGTNPARGFKQLDFSPGLKDFGKKRKKFHTRDPIGSSIVARPSNVPITELSLMENNPFSIGKKLVRYRSTLGFAQNGSMFRNSSTRNLREENEKGNFSYLS